MFTTKYYDIVTIKIEDRSYQVKDTKPLGNVIVHIMNEFLQKSLLTKYRVCFADIDISDCDWECPISKFSEERVVYMIAKEGQDKKYKLKLAQFFATKREKYKWITDVIGAYDYLV